MHRLSSRSYRKDLRWCLLAVGRALLLIAAVVGLGLAPAGAQSATRPRYAQPGDITCSLMILAKEGTITAGEPLIARMEIRNQSKEEISLPSGGTHLEVHDGSGELVAATPRPQSRNVGEIVVGIYRMPPGETQLRFLVLTGLYQFKEPGRYTVRVEQLGFPLDFPVLCEGAASVQVLPYDAARLEAACEDLFAPSRKRSSPGDIPLGVRRKALYSVRDDVVLPYLEWLVREMNAEYAALAIRRIRTPRAEKLLAALAARNDEAGEAARQALKMRLETTSWDVEAE